MDDYLVSYNKFLDSLGRVDEQTFITLYQNNSPGSKEKLILHSLPIVRNVVRSICRRFNQPFDELLCEANLILLEQLPKWSPEKCSIFPFIYIKIKFGIYKYLRETGNFIKIPYSLQKSMEVDESSLKELSQKKRINILQAKKANKVSSLSLSVDDEEFSIDVVDRKENSSNEVCGGLLENLVNLRLRGVDKRIFKMRYGLRPYLCKHSYNFISQQLDVDVKEVKRSVTLSRKVLKRRKSCQWCHRKIYYVYTSRKIYCSDRCSKANERLKNVKFPFIKICKSCKKSFYIYNKTEFKQKHLCAKGCVGKLCEWCDSPFTPKRKDVRFCSKGCKDKYISSEHRITKRSCPICKNNFYANNSHSYICSAHCRNVHNAQIKREKMNPKKICNGCGELFQPAQSRIKYCKKECFYKHSKAMRENH